MPSDACAQGVYRTAGRVPEAAPLPPPRARLLASPFLAALRFTALVLVPPILFDLIVAPIILSGWKNARFVPDLDWIQSGMAILALASFVVLARAIWMRVRPSWGGMTKVARVMYVASMIAMQLVVVGAGELGLLLARGGIQLFGPTLIAMSRTPDQRTAYVYERGLLGCDYDVYVASPLSPIMTLDGTISRASCNEPKPKVRWEAETPRLVDPNGVPLVSQEHSFPLFFGGGC